MYIRIAIFYLDSQMKTRFKDQSWAREGRLKKIKKKEYYYVLRNDQKD